MTKKKLIQTIAKDTGHHRDLVSDILESFMKTVQEETRVEGGKITLAGFGVFEAKRHAPRTFRNPMNGESVHVEERMTTRFRPSKTK